MSSLSYGGSDPLSVTAGESSATTDGGATRAQPVSRRWPCQLVIDQNLRPFADSAWDGSATFRHQCRTLGAARATVIVTAASPRELDRAAARIEMSTQGTVFARVRVRLGRDANIVELIAHEVEHVLERVEGINLLLEWRHGSSRVTLLSGGAFETGRAIDVGRRVAREVHEAERRERAARTSEGAPKSPVAKSVVKFFEAQQVTSIDEFLGRLRPAPLDPSMRDAVIATLPGEGERPKPTEVSKIEAARPVVEYHARGAVVTFKVIEVGHAFVGLHARSVLLASRDALALIDGQEFAALVAHEISHEYVWDEYQRAMQRQDHKTMQALELRCDGVAVLTLRRLGLDPARLVSAVQKMTRFNQHRSMVASTKDYVSLTERVAFIRAIATMQWREGGWLSPEAARLGGPGEVDLVTCGCGYRKVGPLANDTAAPWSATRTLVSRYPPLHRHDSADSLGQ